MNFLSSGEEKKRRERRIWRENERKRMKERIKNMSIIKDRGNE